MSVLLCNNKSGEGLIETFKESVSSFNKVIAHLRGRCPWLFEFENKLQRIPALALESCESYGSDGGGGARSKYVSENQRIKAFNPHNIDIWCVPHRSHKVSEHTSSATAFGEEHLKLCCQVQEIFIASAELQNLLENAQIVTGEVKQFRSEKSVHLKDYVMH